MCGTILKKTNTQSTPSLPPVADWLKGPIENSEGAWYDCESWHRMLYWERKRYSGRSRGGARGGRPPLFPDQNEGRRAKKKFFWGRAPPYLRVWMTPAPYLKVWIRHCGIIWGRDYRSSELAGLSWKRRVIRNLNPPYRLFNSFLFFLLEPIFNWMFLRYWTSNCYTTSNNFFYHNFIVFISLFVGNRRSGIEENDVSYVLNKDFRLSSLLTDAAAEALARKRETNAAQ